MRARLLFLIFSLLPALTGCYLLRFQDAENLLKPVFCDWFLWLWYNLPHWFNELPLILILVIIMGLIWCASLLIRYEGKKAKAPMMFTLAKDTIIAVILSGILAWTLPTLGNSLLTTFHTQFGQQGWIFLAGLAALIFIYYLSYALNGHGWTRFWKAILVLAYAVSFISLTYASPSSPLFFVLAYLLIETYVICLRTFHTSSEMPKQNDLPDAFGRQSVVDDCINRLRRSNELNEPCNIALTGKWGSGKTFTMREVFQRLKNGRPADKTSNQPAEEPTPVLYINPWHLHSITEIQNAIIDGIYHTIRPRSCFSFPPLFKLLRHLILMAGEPRLTHCYDALTELIKTPGSLDTTSAQLTLNAAIQQPIVIFLDDLERVQPEVLKQIFPLLDSISQISKIHFYVSINEETLHSFKEEKALRDLYGYFNKVFHAPIPIPSIHQDCYLAFVKSYIVRKLNSGQSSSHHSSELQASQLSDENKKRLEIISAVFKSNSEYKNRFCVFYPPTPRILIHSLDSMISLTQGPLEKLLHSHTDCRSCWGILQLHHFFFCMKEESPALYSLISNAKARNYANVLHKLVEDNSMELPPWGPSTCGESHRQLSLKPDAENYELLNYIHQHLYASDNRTSRAMSWSPSDLDTVLHGELYYDFIPTHIELAETFRQAQKGKPVSFSGKTDEEKDHKLSYFWKEVTMLICTSTSKLPTYIPSECTSVLQNNTKQITQYEDIIFPILYEYSQSLYQNCVLELTNNPIKILIDNLSVNASLNILAIKGSPNRDHTLTESYFGQSLIERVKRYFSHEFGQQKNLLPIHHIRTLVEDMGRVDAPFAKKLEIHASISLESSAAKTMALKMACILTEYIGPTYELAKNNLLPALLNSIQQTSFKPQGENTYISEEYVESFHSDQKFFSLTTSQLHETLLSQKIDELLDQ